MLELEFEKMHALEQKHWWFKAKRLLAVHFAKKFLRHRGNAKIADIGCGTGSTLAAMEKEGFSQAVGFDKSAKAVAYCREKNLRISMQDIFSIRRKNAFDCILLLDVLEHVEQDKKALDATFKLLKKNGIAIINVPAFQFLFSQHDLAFGHKRRYDEKSLISLLEKSGFIIEKKTYWDFFLFFPVALFKLLGLRAFSRQSKGSDIFPVPEPFNSILSLVLAVELFFVFAGISLPFGTSFFCIARKVQKK